MLKSTCPKHDVHTLQAEKGSADISWGYSDPYGESVLPFLLFRIGLTISVPVLSISHAKLCIRQRKALQLPTQSFASANAKHCISQRKALHNLTYKYQQQRRMNPMSLAGRKGKGKARGRQRGKGEAKGKSI